MHHCGYVIHFWGEREQSRLLATGIRPLVEELLAAGNLRRFYFDRQDLRGPHLVLLLSFAEKGAGEEGARVAEHLAALLRDAPSTTELPPEAIEKIHREGRGKVLYPPHLLPGMAANNTLIAFEPSLDGYPYWASRGIGRFDELWDLLDGLARWVLDRLAIADGVLPLATAVRWLAGLDTLLPTAGLVPAEYWPFHASTLIAGLDKHLVEDAGAVLATLPKAIGEKNQAAIAGVWDDSATFAGAWPHLPELLALVACDPDLPRRRALLRELIHITLKQLLIPVNLHVPLVFFAWNRSLAPVLGAADQVVRRGDNASSGLQKYQSNGYSFKAVRA